MDSHRPQLEAQPSRAVAWWAPQAPRRRLRLTPVQGVQTTGPWSLPPTAGEGAHSPAVLPARLHGAAGAQLGTREGRVHVYLVTLAGRLGRPCCLRNNL